jgi:hydroxymethylglutaryl-CoA reductase (NADPH)
MLRSAVRSTLLSLSSLAAAAPIEVITATFILVTLTYFQLLQAIKGSEFFQLPATTSVSAPPTRPIHLVRLSNPSAIDESDAESESGSGSGFPYVLPSPSSPLFNSFSNSNQWSPLPVSDFRRILEANALEGGYTFPPEFGGNQQGDKAEIVLVKQITVVREDVEASTKEWEDWVLREVGIELGGQRYTYQDLCYECDTHLAPHPLHPSQSTLTLYLQPPTPETPTLTYLNHLARLPPFTPPGSNTTFRILPAASSSWGFLPSFDGAGLFAGLGDSSAGQNEREEEELLSGLRNVRWFAYAVRAFVMRFYALAKVGSSSTPIASGGQLADTNTRRTPTLPTSLSSSWATSSCTRRLSTSSSTCAKSARPSGYVS